MEERFVNTLYVTDLDGTLLNSNDQVSQYSIQTINGLVAKLSLIHI